MCLPHRGETYWWFLILDETFVGVRVRAQRRVLHSVKGLLSLFRSLKQLQVFVFAVRV